MKSTNTNKKTHDSKIFVPRNFHRDNPVPPRSLPPSVGGTHIHDPSTNCVETEHDNAAAVCVSGGEGIWHDTEERRGGDTKG